MKMKLKHGIFGWSCPVIWSVGIYHYVNADIPTTILLFFSPGLAYHMFAFFPLVAMLERPTEFNVVSVSEPKKKLSTFQAWAAEAELDMLLDSFSETKLLDSSGFTFAAAPVHQKEASVHLPKHTRNTLGSLKSTPLSAKLDDGLDDVQFIRLPTVKFNHLPCL